MFEKFKALSCIPKCFGRDGGILVFDNRDKNTMPASLVCHGHAQQFVPHQEQLAAVSSVFIWGCDPILHK